MERKTCSKCGHTDFNYGLKITKKMIREIPTRKDCWYALKCIYEQCECKKNRKGIYTLRFTPNQLEFIRACKKYNIPGIILHDWVKYVD